MDIKSLREEYNKTYDKGIVNHLIRTWYYLQKGLALMNDFKYLVAGILAFYYALQLDSWIWIVVIFIVALPILIFVGYVYTFKMAKALEWTNMMFATYFSRYGTDLSEKNVEINAEQLKLLEQILEQVKKNNAK